MTVEDLKGPSHGDTIATSGSGSKHVLDNKSEPSKYNDAISEKAEEEEEQAGVIDEANIGLDKNKMSTNEEKGQA